MGWQTPKASDGGHPPGDDPGPQPRSDAPGHHPGMDFKELYRTHFSSVRRWVRNLGVLPGDVDDVVQEVFLVAMRRLPEFDGSSPRAWLFAISRRTAGNHRRSRARAGAREEQSQPPGEPERPDRVAMLREAHHALQGMLDQLAEDQRLVFVLFEIEGMRAAEVASALSISEKLVYSRLRSARGHLQRMIEARHPEPEVRHARANG